MADYRYGKDKNFVFHQSSKMEGLNARKFKILGDTAIKSFNDCYFIGENVVYNSGELVEKADAKSFRLDSLFGAIDKNHAYFGHYSVKNIDPNTVEVFDRKLGLSGFVKDKNAVFFDHDTVLGAYVKTFRPLPKKNYGVDQYSVFYKTHLQQWLKLNKIDCSLFGDYIKDESTVFFESVKIEGADANNFRSFINSRYSTDGHSVYFESYKLPDLVPENIERLDCDCEYNSNHPQCFYIKDDWSVYYATEKIDGADAKTFQLANGKGLKYDALDKFRKYSYGLPIK